ncbi:glycosyltransferase [Dactylosporangium sp. CA-092794]|uniref:glycosyltransferase family 4 protein n=1 Tax=Dactylosporangium sp. CA-092794 TaxID=3239929 RepID=UPI003D89D5E9
MRVLMIAWDFPSSVDITASGDARHGRIAALSTALVAGGHEVTVVSRHHPDTPANETFGGVRVVRAAALPPFDDADLGHTMAVNHLLAEAAIRTAPPSAYEVIHAHDWLVTHAAVTLKEHFGIPFVATLQDTEAGRHQGYLPGETSRSVHSVEWWLGTEACRVIVPTEYLRWEVQHLFDVPAERVDVVPSGIDPDIWTAEPRAVLSARLRFAGEGPLIVYAGRLIAEKGVQDLLAAMPSIRERHPGTRAVVAGDGDYRGTLIEESRRLKLHRAVSFPGTLDQPTLAAVLAAADAFVMPSRYEPTGTVALEAAASGAALLVASTGGLASIVEHGVTGIRFPAGDPDGLADAVTALLQDPMLAQSLASRARQMVREHHSWRATAARTAAVYGAAIDESPAFEARRHAALVGSGLPVVFVPPGNLLADPPAVPVGARPSTPTSPGAHLATSSPGARLSAPASAADHLPGSVGAADRLPGSTSASDRLPGSLGAADRLPGSTSASDRLPGSTSASDRLPGSASGSGRLPGSVGAADRQPGSADASDRQPGSAGASDRLVGPASADDSLASAADAGDRQASAAGPGGVGDRSASSAGVGDRSACPAEVAADEAAWQAGAEAARAAIRAEASYWTEQAVAREAAAREAAAKAAAAPFDVLMAAVERR